MKTNYKKRNIEAGISCIEVYIPRLYVDMEELGKGDVIRNLAWCLEGKIHDRPGPEDNERVDGVGRHGVDGSDG
jgi:hypothetical protein